MNPPMPIVAKVTVTIETADGRIHTITSRPNAIDQEQGVCINEDLQRLSDLDSSMQDHRLTRTVTWVERWTEYQ